MEWPPNSLDMNPIEQKSQSGFQYAFTMTKINNFKFKLRQMKAAPQRHELSPGTQRVIIAMRKTGVSFAAIG